MTTSLMPTVLVANTHKSILNYVAQRTGETIGDLVDSARLVIVGRVEETEPRSIPMRPEDVAALQRWSSGEAGAGSKIIVYVTRLQVEKKIINGNEAKLVELAYPGSSGSGGPDFFPIFNVGDRALMLLREVSTDAPYASYIQRPAYQLAAGEKGMRKFQVTDYDDKGRPFTRDETGKVEEAIAAVEWYAALPQQDAKAIHQALLKALDSTNPRVVHHAIRALARQGDPSVARTFKDKLQGASEELRVRLMLGLWILGEQESAESTLDDFFQKQGKYKWLEQWEVKPTVMEAGLEADTLYGPDPSEVKGD